MQYFSFQFNIVSTVVVYFYLVARRGTLLIYLEVAYWFKVSFWPKILESFIMRCQWLNFTPGEV